MPNLKHLIISTQGEMYDEATAPMIACLRHLAQLETLDLKLIGSRHNVRVRPCFLSLRACAQSQPTRPEMPQGYRKRKDQFRIKQHQQRNASRSACRIWMTRNVSSFQVYLSGSTEYIACASVTGSRLTEQ